MSYSLGILFPATNFNVWFNETVIQACSGAKGAAQQGENKLHLRDNPSQWWQERFWNYDPSMEYELHVFPDERDPWAYEGAKHHLKRHDASAIKEVQEGLKNDQALEGGISAKDFLVIFAGGSINLRALPGNMTIVEIRMHNPDIKPVLEERL